MRSAIEEKDPLLDDLLDGFSKEEVLRLMLLIFDDPASGPWEAVQDRIPAAFKP